MCLLEGSISNSSGLYLETLKAAKNVVDSIGKDVLISCSGGIPCLMKPNKFGYLLYTTSEAVECHDSMPDDISVEMV